MKQMTMNVIVFLREGVFRARTIEFITDDGSPE